MEASDVKAIRETLNDIGNACAWIADNCNDSETAKYMWDLVEKVKAALSAPPRNCDVGTLAEQQQRFHDVNEEQQRLLVKSCGDVFMFYIIDWDTRQSYFEVKCHDSALRHQTVVGADEVFRLLCDMEKKRGAE